MRPPRLTPTLMTPARQPVSPMPTVISWTNCRVRYSTLARAKNGSAVSPPTNPVQATMCTPVLADSDL